MIMVHQLMQIMQGLHSLSYVTFLVMVHDVGVTRKHYRNVSRIDFHQCSVLRFGALPAQFVFASIGNTGHFITGKKL
jgi:hypothetical protein